MRVERTAGRRASGSRVSDVRIWIPVFSGIVSNPGIVPKLADLRGWFGRGFENALLQLDSAQSAAKKEIKKGIHAGPSETERDWILRDLCIVINYTCVYMYGTYQLFRLSHAELFSFKPCSSVFVLYL